MKWTDLPLDEEAIARLKRLRALIVERNEKLNLTRITDEPSFVEKHVQDSLLGLEGAEGVASWVDVGAGGGFPGLAVAIARPLCRVLLVEAAKKKARFLEEVARALGLANVEVAAERAEDAARARLDSFDRASIRAVGTVALSLEYALPFVRPGGAAVLYRGPENAAEEEREARRVAPLLGGGEPRFSSFALASGEKRRLVFVTKTGPTPPGIPRRTGVAAKRPL